jgi:hypothetical protein
LRNSSSRLANWFFLVPKHQDLAWYPSPSLLLIHFLVPAALIFCSWRTLRAADF